MQKIKNKKSILLRKLQKPGCLEFTTAGRKMHCALLDASCLQSTELIEAEDSHGQESK